MSRSTFWQFWMSLRGRFRNRRNKAGRGATPPKRARLGLEYLEIRLAPVTDLYSNAAGGLWSLDANWSLGARPTAIQDATISVGAAAVAHAAGADTVHTLISDGSLTDSGGSIAVTGDIGGEVHVTGTAQLSLTGTGSTQGNVTLDVAGGAAVTLSGSLDNTGRTLTVNGGTLVLTGTLKGGTLNLINGATLDVRSGTLDGLTIDGNLTVKNNLGGTVKNGLTLNGTASLGALDGSSYGQLYFQGTQTLAGSGTVTFGGSTSNALYAQGGVATLTIGSGVTVQGKAGSVTAYGTYGATESFVNKGTIGVSSGGTLALGGTGWSNAGTITANGATVLLGGSFTMKTLGNFSASGGTVNLTGTLNNAGATLALSPAIGFWVMRGGAIVGGTITSSGGSYLALSNVGATFSGVTIASGTRVDGTYYFGYSGGNAFPVVTNGLTLDGTLALGSADGSVYEYVLFQGTQTLGGSGTVILGKYSGNGLYAQGNGGSSPATLTVGAGIAVQGGGGTVAGYYGNDSVVFDGTLSAGTPGVAVTLGGGGSGKTLANYQSISAANGAAVTVPESLQVDGSAVVTVSANSSLTVAGNLLGKTQNIALFKPLGTVTLKGAGTAAAPELFEAMSADGGKAPANFDNNFAFGTLVLAGNTYVKLVDQSRNSAGSAAEAVYVNSLIVPAGCTLDLNGLNLYVRDAQIDVTVVGGSITQIPDSGPLTVGSPTPGKIAVAGELDAWTFFGRGGSTVAVAVDPGSGVPGGPIAPTLGWAQVQLLDSANHVLASTNSTSAGAVVTLTNVALPADGVYTIAIKAAVGHTASTGDYVVSAYDVTPSVQSLNVNQTVTGTLANPFSADQYTFAVAANTQVQFDLLAETTSGLGFTLTGPNGFAGFTNITGSSPLVTLPAAGTYTLTAQGTGGATGKFTFRMAQTSQTTLALGVPYNGTFAGSGQPQLFAVALPTAAPLFLKLADAAPADHVELYARFGSAPTREDYDYSVNGAGASQSLLVPSAAAGTWYVLAYAESVAVAPASFTLTADSQSVFATGITPSHAGTGAQDTVGITGAGFDSNTTVRFVGANGETYSPLTVKVVSGVAMQATLDLPKWVPDVYSVLVTEGDTTAKLAGAFQVTPGGKPHLDVELILPSALGRHADGTIWVQYGNSGDVAIPAPILEVDATNHALMTLDPALNGPGLATPTLPPGISDRLQFLGVGSSATPGLIQPGETFRVPIYYRGLLQPWDFSQASVHFHLSAIDDTDTTPIDYTSMAQQDQLTDLLPADRPTFWNALKGLTGDTWGALDVKLAGQATGSSPYQLDQLLSGLFVAAAYSVGSGSGQGGVAGRFGAFSDGTVTFGPLAFGDVIQAGDSSQGSIKTVLFIKGFGDTAPIGNAQNAASNGVFPGATIIAVDWTLAANPFGLFPLNYPLAAEDVYDVGDEIANWMKVNGIDPSTTVIFGHSLGGQVAAEVGRDVQVLFPGRELEAIYAADAAGPGFDNLSPKYRLDPSDAAWVEDIHTTFLFGDPYPIATKDIYVIGASWNPITAHSQAWDVLMQSLTDHTMTTVFGDGVGPFSKVRGIDFYDLSGGTDRQPAQTDPLNDFIPNGPDDPAVGDPPLVTSFDPNDLIGPIGSGDANFVAAGATLPYRIDFENAPTASAPAQTVTISDHLFATLDWSTFRLTELGFGDTMFTIPPDSRHFQTTMALTYDGKTFDVLVEAGIHSDTGEVYATFQSLDPNTELPPDVLTGFLPPEDGTGRGMGHLSFTVAAKPGLPTGTQIINVAQITFDQNAVIATDQVSETDPSQGIDPKKQALVTLDAVAPTSSVGALPATSPRAFPVTWAGQDDAGGSGVASYTVYVSDDGGAFTPWLTDTPLTSATFTGTSGHTYGFFSVAKDGAGNVEAMPTQAQASTTVRIDPTLLTQVVNAYGSHAATMSAVASTANPSVVGQAVTLSVSVGSAAGNADHGTVTFLDGSTAIGMGTYSAATGKWTLTTPALSQGSHAITATFGGNEYFSSASTPSALAQVVGGPGTHAVTMSAIASTANPSVVGQAVTLSVSVGSSAGNADHGTVSFFDGSTFLGYGTYDPTTRRWTLTTSGLAVGTRSITATFSGNEYFAAST